MLKKINTSIPFLIIVLLAALAIPRVVIHDLHALPLDSIGYKALAIIPFALWVLVALLGKSKRPVHDFLVLGLVFGLMLAITHQITWDASWGNNPPQLQGNFEGALSPAIESLLIRTSAVFSSLITGLALGGATALIAWGASKVRKR